MRKIRCLLLGVVAVAALATIGATSATAKIGISAGKAVSGSPTTCPNSPPGNLQASNNVGASVKTSGSTNTYFFESFENENPVEGVPGLIKYCVYPTSSTVPTEVAAAPAGWLALRAKKGSAFSFVRPGGNKTNIPLDGKTTEMGTATWEGTAPTEAEQTIVLHINDPTVCAALYPAGQEGVPPGTCFVLPGEREQKPVCNAGGSGLFAYNAIPKDFLRCPGPPSEAFEAQGVSEFGDAVELKGGVTEITSMTVDFQSYACDLSGHWNTGVSAPCVSGNGDTFNNVPITAHIYNETGGELGKVTVSPTIPYRPSADSVKCPGGPEGESGSRWFNEERGACAYSISKPVEFTFSPGIAVPSSGKVIWTVSFNTSTAGYAPLAPQACNATEVGCTYDSLNVGTLSYENAPYIGKDLNPEGVYINKTATPANLAEEGGWAGLRPLAQITTGP